MRSFTYLVPERVRSGAGSLAQVPDELRRIGSRRAFVLSTRSLDERSSALRTLEKNLGALWAGSFARCRQHVPADSVAEATDAARLAGADAIVAFGGGSVIDTAKVVALRAVPEGAAPLPQLAIPTTLSAGEFTPAAGVTDERTRVKGLVFDLRILPRVVVLAPEATLDTPKELWLSTGAKALDHALESVWSVRAHPLVDALALEAIRKLVRHLPESRDPAQVEAREQCQLGAWLSISGAMNVGFRLSHPLGHQIGARWDVPHGVTSCIVLPAVMRLLAPRTLPAQWRIAEALGVRTEGRAAETVAAEGADRLEAFIAALGVPTRLSKAGAVHEQIGAVAHAVCEELAKSARGAAPEFDERQLTRLLDSVW
jgi:alcohol dehydrogenase class IV